MKKDLLNHWVENRQAMGRSVLWQFLTVGSLLLFAGCGKHEQPAADALARVGDKVVSEAEFRSWWEQRRPAADTSAARQLVVKQLVERSALAQAAREAGLDKDPAVIEQIENILIGRLKETRLQPELKALTIPEADLRADYQQNLESKFSVPGRTHAAVLWFDTRGQAPLVARYTPRLEQARQTAASLPADQGFGTLALQNTEDRASRYRGGDVGWLEDSPANDPWKKQVLEIATQLKQPGDLSQVVTTDRGSSWSGLWNASQPGSNPSSRFVKVSNDVCWQPVARKRRSSSPKQASPARLCNNSRSIYENSKICPPGKRGNRFRVPFS